jgi:methylated-DNA-[protein]-cysteine S-methyltransferase
MFIRSAAQAPPEHLKRVDSPIGRLEITSDGTAITSLSIERNGELPFDDVAENSSPLLELAAGQLGEYFAGTRASFELPIIVPCHRVLATGGKITGYSAGNGIPTKVWLLEHEGIEHRL